jgi:Zn-dependent peptidase ImmA (M78 family)
MPLAWPDPEMREAPAEVLEWEGIAADLGSEIGCNDPPVDAFEIADQCELTIEPADVPTAEIDHDRRVIKLNVQMRRERQHMSVAHEVGHFALVRAGLHNDCPGARYIAGALMMPWAPFDRDLTRTAWAMEALRAAHPNASATAIAVRISQLRDAVVTILDPRGRRKHWRITSPWIVDPRLRRVTAWERELARLAYEQRAEVRGDQLCYACPLIEGDEPTEHRVLVVCELEQLSLRL